MTTDLQTITSLVQLQMDQEDRIANLEESLDRAREELRTTREELLPVAMLSCGFSNLPVTTLGVRVIIAPGLDAHIPSLSASAKFPELKLRREKAIDWLETSGHEIVKHEVIGQFNTEEKEKATQAYDLLKRLTKHVIDTKNVHPQTLLAWAREQIRLNLVVPEDLFAFRRYHIAKITRGSNKGILTND